MIRAGTMACNPIAGAASRCRPKRVLEPARTFALKAPQGSARCGRRLLRPPMTAVTACQGLANDLRLAGDDVEVGLGRGVRFLAALLPVPQRSDGDVIAGGEVLLAEPEGAANHAHLWHPGRGRPLRVGHGPRIGVGHGSGVALLV